MPLQCRRKRSGWSGYGRTTFLNNNKSSKVTREYKGHWPGSMEDSAIDDSVSITTVSVCGATVVDAIDSSVTDLSASSSSTVCVRIHDWPEQPICYEACKSIFYALL